MNDDEVSSNSEMEKFKTCNIDRINAVRHKTGLYTQSILGEQFVFGEGAMKLNFGI